jgi:hypothetical protein
MIFISGILLLYSAVVVPFQICVWDYSDPCNMFPTLYFDIYVDMFFLVRKRALLSTFIYPFQIRLQETVGRNVLNVLDFGQFEVFCQFFIGYVDPDGKYVDDLSVVAKKYFSNPSSFGFDFATSLPWSFVDIGDYKVLL